jgi:hypothetical protein
MGLTSKWYGVTLVVVGISTFPITAPTLGAASVSIGTVGCGISMIFC